LPRYGSAKVIVLEGEKGRNTFTKNVFFSLDREYSILQGTGSWNDTVRESVLQAGSKPTTHLLNYLQLSPEHILSSPTTQHL
jgi:hypothetical protein